MRIPANAIYEKTSEKDICNICLRLQSEELTRDHVPPLSSLRDEDDRRGRRRDIGRVSIEPLFSRADRPQYSQCGIRYKTICAICNNDRLGRDYDPALIEMCRQADRLHRSHRLLIRPPCVEIDPGKVLRAIFGHLLAAKTTTPRTMPEEQMRAFFSDPASTDLGELRVLYWAHPDKSIRLMRSTYLFDFETRTGSFCDLLIWYPLGFLVCDKPPFDMVSLDHYVGLPNPTQVPLRALASGVFERWFNRMAKVTDGDEDVAIRADGPRRLPKWPR